MAQQRELFSDLLRVVNHMKAFVSHRMGGEERLRLRLEQSKATLATARKVAAENAEALKRLEGDNEAFWVELKREKTQGEVLGVRLGDVEHKKTRLEENVKDLWTYLASEKKQKEDLHLRLIAQREELEAGFVEQRKELETKYQKQVDEMYFFGYRCCIKNNGIKRDIPSIPPSEEDKIHRDPP